MHAPAITAQALDPAIPYLGSLFLGQLQDDVLPRRASNSSVTDLAADLFL